MWVMPVRSRRISSGRKRRNWGKRRMSISGGRISMPRKRRIRSRISRSIRPYLNCSLAVLLFWYCSVSGFIRPWSRLTKNSGKSNGKGRILYMKMCLRASTMPRSLIRDKPAILRCFRLRMRRILGCDNLIPKSSEIVRKNVWICNLMEMLLIECCNIFWILK